LTPLPFGATGVQPCVPGQGAAAFGVGVDDAANAASPTNVEAMSDSTSIGAINDIFVRLRILVSTFPALEIGSCGIGSRVAPGRRLAALHSQM
jgi:hypothetical protein